MQNKIKGISTDAIEQQLHRLRSSPLFSHSRRYPIFLDYVVRKTLEGHGDELKERTVGVEAFGRPSGYDLNADPVVRVTAGEVRKRLAQYYYQVDHHHELRIELNPGSYVPEFRFAGLDTAKTGSLQAEAAQPNTQHADPILIPPAAAHVTIVPAATQPLVPAALAPGLMNAQVLRQLLRWKRISASLAVGLLLAAGAAALPLLHRASSTDAFWQPVLEVNGPVLISVASVVAMVNSNAVAPAPSTVSGHPLASDPIAVSDATALSSIQQVLSMRSKRSTLESSTSTSFSDLQKGPIVLISGFNNQWTMRITAPLRFHFVRTSTDDYTIQDRSFPSHQWGINTAGPFVAMNHDYGIIARFHDPTTEQLVVVAAGIGENGTIAASTMLTDEKYLSELKQSGILPRPNQNFEAIIETLIIDGRPGPPRIVASYLW